MSLIGRIQEKALGAWLDFATRQGALEKLLASMRTRRGESCAPAALAASPQTVRVAAMQVEFELTKTPRAFVAQVHRLLSRAVEQGAQVAVFPEELGTELLGLVPGIGRMLTGGLPDPGKGGEAPASGPEPIAVLRFVAPAVRRVFETTFSTLARDFGIWVYTGSVNLPGPDGRVCNRSFLYDAEGRRAGSHEKLHLLPVEANLGLSRGSRLEVFDTPWCRVAIPICMDSTYFETFRAASSLGAELVLLGVCDAQPYNFWKAHRGLWPRVQESGVYGAMSPVVGRFLGLPATQHAAIFAPLELTEGRDGVVALSPDVEREQVVVATLDLARLRAWRGERGPQRAYNLDLYRRELPQVYADAERRWGKRRTVLQEDEPQVA